MRLVRTFRAASIHVRVDDVEAGGVPAAADLHVGRPGLLRDRHPGPGQPAEHLGLQIGAREVDVAHVGRETLVQLKFTIVTVLSVLALAFVMNLSGQTASLGTALASAGGLFVVLSPVLGWLGVAITGSDTSSNSLFGVLQVTAANKVGLDAVLMAATNSSAGVMGKMLSPQNLAVAAAAVGMSGQEGDIFRRLIGWSLALLAAFTVLVVLQATVLSWMVP
jgi:lactate permease